MAVQMIINQKGPLPITAQFNSIGDSPMFLEINGSVWTSTPNVMIGINIAIDGQGVGTAFIFSNGPTTERQSRLVSGRRVERAAELRSAPRNNSQHEPAGNDY